MLHPPIFRERTDREKHKQQDHQIDGPEGQPVGQDLCKVARIQQAEGECPPGKQRAEGHEQRRQRRLKPMGRTVGPVPPEDQQLRHNNADGPDPKSNQSSF